VIPTLSRPVPAGPWSPSAPERDPDRVRRVSVPWTGQRQPRRHRGGLAAGGRGLRRDRALLPRGRPPGRGRKGHRRRAGGAGGLRLRTVSGPPALNYRSRLPIHLLTTTARADDTRPEDAMITTVTIDLDAPGAREAW